ncbi:MAG: response regulator transcription factor [Sphingobacteriales bacterium]|uniref:LuxR C-terminal-related transcriptional regulator n=1 Tax=Hydrotalea flava TaxID=714549 RepID=UPI00082C5C76|nr:LuxR C-terminal-related transcriptional regulator [Hydrotalea flava]RTL55511.1 MAG: response regulator transcription factor [Sphingobacteriales bacterium]
MKVFIYHNQADVVVLVRHHLEAGFASLSIVLFNDCIHFLQQLHFAKPLPHFIILGLSSKKIESLALIEFISTHYAGLPLLLVVSEVGVKQVKDALALGVSAVVLENNIPQELPEAVAAIFNHQLYFSAQLGITAKIHKILREERWAEQLNMKSLRLTATERSIISLLPGTLSYKEIGLILNKEEKTIEVYIQRICKKLNIEGGRMGLLIYCISRKFIRIGDASF